MNTHEPESSQPENIKDKKIDANAIVSPKNTEKVYGDKLDIKEEPAGQVDTTPISLPDEVDNVDENLFPSAD